jgi:hypothetical protein
MDNNNPSSLRPAFLWNKLVTLNYVGINASDFLQYLLKEPMIDII